MENNILKWYNFKRDAKTIEINKETDLEEITEKYDYVILYDLSDKNIQRFNSKDYEKIFVGNK